MGSLSLSRSFFHALLFLSSLLNKVICHSVCHSLETKYGQFPSVLAGSCYLPAATVDDMERGEFVSEKEGKKKRYHDVHYTDKQAADAFQIA